jgi:hypothetical protein
MDSTQPNPTSSQPAPEEIEDQDAEPTMNAPEEQRPDGMKALEDEDETGTATKPSGKE